MAVENQPGLSQPNLSWNTQPAEDSTYQNKGDICEGTIRDLVAEFIDPLRESYSQLTVGLKGVWVLPPFNPTLKVVGTGNEK